MPTALLTNYAVVTSGGTALPSGLQKKLLDLDIESTYNRPDLCLLTFDIDTNTEIPPALELGKPLEVAFKADRAATKVFVGEITALEWDSTDQRSVFIVQAEDKFHRLFRGDKLQTFVNMTVSDAVKKVIRDAGLAPQVADTTSVLPFLMQQNVSDGAFVLERAAEAGFHARFKDGKVFWGKVGAGGDSGVTLEHGADLLAFNCRVKAGAHLDEVVVRSWDVVAKKAINGRATAYAGTTDSKVKSAGFGQAKVLLSRSDVGSPDEAKASAQAAIDRSNELNRQADGRCHGDARLAVDKEVTIKGVNERFNGNYRISHLRHRYSHDQGFTTEFSCRGVSDQSLAGLVQESSSSAATGPDRSVFEGVTVGIVTDLKDPDDLGRVKVKLPSLDEEQGVTHWMRLAFPGGGGSDKTHHGWYLLPEVNDEVLVIFEQGDARRGYVLGGLLNGKDKPFYKKDADIDKGTVNKHAFRTKTGAHLLFDETRDKEVIEIRNKDGCFTFKYSQTDGVEIKHSGKGEKFAINNNGDITISGDKNITIQTKSGGNITLKSGKDIILEASGKVGIKATQDATLDGMNVKVTGQMTTEVTAKTMAKVDGGVNTTIKGAMVMIN